MKRSLLVAVSLLAIASLADAQGLPSGRPHLLFVRFHGQPGMRVTFHRDQSGPREFEVPVTVGLRPGYIYRVKITGLPGRPDVVLYPTLEVRGTLHLPQKIDPAEHPAPVTFTDNDLEHVLGGVFLTKVVYLEHPEKATPTATRPGEPLETTLPGGSDPLASAREFGRPMVIVRLGSRPVEAAELARQAVPGTVLFPGEKTLPAPRVAPWVPWACVPIYDPVLGPKMPEEEYLQDGGDTGRRASIGPDGRVAGLDPTDSVVEYTDARGRRKLTASNRVCLCVPRFAVLRTEVPLAAFEKRVGPEDAQFLRAQSQLAMRLPSQQTSQAQQPTAMRGRERASSARAETAVGRLVRLDVLDAYEMKQGPADRLGTATLSQLSDAEKVRLTRQMAFARSFHDRQGVQSIAQNEGTSVVGRADGLQLVSATLETADVTAICEEPPQVLTPDKPLRLYKWADRDAAQVGDVVTFFLKFSNVGGQPISDIAVSDSLSGRLEYIPNSAKSDRNAVFTLQQNEAGSVILRWEISGRLLPGQSGVVSFQARVR